jgi:hypothetical protein
MDLLKYKNNAIKKGHSERDKRSKRDKGQKGQGTKIKNIFLKVFLIYYIIIFILYCIIFIFIYLYLHIECPFVPFLFLRMSLLSLVPFRNPIEK